MNLEHHKKIRDLVQEAEKFGLLLEVPELMGFSGEKLIGALQRIAKYQESIGAGCYLEIGVFQGLTLLSVASVLDEVIAYGIDNFSQFDPQKLNQSVISEKARVNNFRNFLLINSDYEDALENLQDYLGDSKIGTYFIDGPHDYRSQLICLQLVKPYLSDLSVIVVDDSNYRHVRLANRDFLLANPEFKLLFESYTKCHPGNMDKNSEQEARKGWWNGVNIIVCDPNNKLSKMVPETIRDRQLYENEHIVHSAKYGFLAPEAIFFVQSLISFRLLSAFKQLMKMGIKYRKINKERLGCYDSMNTYSENLPQRGFNSKSL